MRHDFFLHGFLDERKRFRDSSPNDYLEDRRALLPPQESDARSEGAAVEGAEGQELRRADVIVHDKRIFMVRNVVEAAAQSPVEAKQVKSLFELQIQRIIGWKAVRSRCPLQLLLVVNSV